MDSNAVTLFPSPALGLLVAEPIRAVLDLCAAKLKHPPRYDGDGHPVVVYPGLGAGPLATTELRQYLRSCHFDAQDWGLGINTGPEGDLEEWLALLVKRIEDLHASSARRVSLVGWSLGGIYAREIAKRCPNAVRQVVTLATPFAALRSGNRAGALLRLLGGDTAGLTPEREERLRTRPPTPTTSIYSESDGVISWRGCLEQPAPQVENVPVHASHLGMPSHPEVLRVVADRLAQAEGAWRPYRAASGPSHV